MSSIRVSTKMKSRLARIAARLTLEDGKTRSMEEILGMLADAYEEREKGFDRMTEFEKKVAKEFMDSYKKTGFGEITQQTRNEAKELMNSEFVDGCETTGSERN